MVGAGGEAGDAVYDYPVRLGFLPKGARDGYDFWEGRVMTWGFSSRGGGVFLRCLDGEKGMERESREDGGRGGTSGAVDSLASARRRGWGRMCNYYASSAPKSTRSGQVHTQS